MVATLVGELDLPAADSAFDAIDRAARDAGELILDLSGLTFIDSSGLRLVVRLAAGAREEAFRLSIVRGSDQVQRVFQIVGLLEALPWTSD